MGYCSVTISSENLSGQTCNVVFMPATGGTITLGTQTFPFTYTSDYFYGIYECYVPEYNYVYSVNVTPPLPTQTPSFSPTPTVTPTVTPTNTLPPVVTPTNTITPTTNRNLIIVNNSTNNYIINLIDDGGTWFLTDQVGFFIVGPGQKLYANHGTTNSNPRCTITYNGSYNFIVKINGVTTSDWSGSGSAAGLQRVLRTLSPATPIDETETVYILITD